MPRRSRVLKPTYPFVRNDASAQAIGLTAWWPGVGAGGQLWDMSARNNHGVLTSFAVPFTLASGWTTGLDGGRGALVFDGSDDVVLWSAARSASYYFANTSPFTFSTWVKISSPVNAYAFIGGVRVGPDFSGWYIYWDKVNARFIFGFLGDNSAYTERYSTGSAVALGAWALLTCARDGSNTVAGTQIYVNGRLDAGTSATNGTPGTVNYGANALGLGKNPQTTAFPYLGAIEDARIYNRALAAAEVWNLYDQRTRWELRGQPGRRTHYGSTAGAGPSGQYIRRARAMSGGFVAME